MSILYLLIPMALLLGAIGLGLMIWALRNGQFEDLEGPPHRVLFDDDRELIPGNAERAPQSGESNAEGNASGGAAAQGSAGDRG